jgi:uncharacterized membrane protein YccC
MMNIKFISKVVKVIFAAYAAALGMTIITMVIGFMVFGGDLISPFVKSYIGAIIGVLFVVLLPIIYGRISK